MPLARHLLSLTSLAITLAGVAVPAMAQQWPGPRTAPPQDSSRSSQNDTLSDAVRRIERSNRGQILSAEHMQYDGRDVTRIKVVDDEGRVRIYMDDAQSGSEPRRNGGQSDDNTPRQRRRRGDN